MTEQRAVFFHDPHLALRRLRRTPGLSAAVILTFALGIGVNAIMFGIIDRLLLWPPAHLARPEQLSRMLIERTTPEGSRREPVMTYPDFLDLTGARSLTVTAFERDELTLGQGVDARQVNAVLAAENYFGLLDVRPALGRFFGAPDGSSSDRAAVISSALWRSACGGDAQMLGRTLDFGYGPYAIVGVAPSGFNGIGLRPVDLWLPLVPTGIQLQGTRWLGDRGWQSLEAVGRRAQGAPLATALADMER